MPNPTFGNAENLNLELAVNGQIFHFGTVDQTDCWIDGEEEFPLDDDGSACTSPGYGDDLSFVINFYCSGMTIIDGNSAAFGNVTDHALSVQGVRRPSRPDSHCFWRIDARDLNATSIT